MFQLVTGEQLHMTVCAKQIKPYVVHHVYLNLIKHAWDVSNPNSSSNPQTAVITWKQKSPCISECAVNTFFCNYNVIERKRGLGDVGGRGDTVDWWRREDKEMAASCCW